MCAPRSEPHRCGNPLFSAAAKFESGCGWAAFDRCYVNSVTAQADLSHGLARVEVVCRKCAGHLGHLFSGEAVSESNQRHCVNSLSIRYVQDDPPPALLTNGEARVDTASVDRLLASSAARSGAVSSVRPASDLDLRSAALADAWALTRGRERGWLLCGYAAGSKVAVVPTSHGEGGLEELRGHVSAAEHTWPAPAPRARSHAASAQSASNTC